MHVRGRNRESSMCKAVGDVLLDGCNVVEELQHRIELGFSVNSEEQFQEWWGDWEVGPEIGKVNSKEAI